MPQTSPSFIICLEDSENSLTALIFIVMVYYKERIQIKISQRKRPLGAEFGGVGGWRGVPNAKLP